MTNMMIYINKKSNDSDYDININKNTKNQMLML